MSEGHDRMPLHVLCDHSGDIDRWRVVADSAAELVEATGIVHDGPCGPAPSRDQQILDRATALGGPVLVLPTAEAAGEPPATTRRVLAPIDRTTEEHQALAPLLKRAQALGMEIEQLHVLAGPARPIMWEGPGHHAEAWLEQLRHGHQIGDATVAVRSGEPASAIRAAAPRADLLVVCWSGDARRGHARVLRSLLRHAHQPLLLVRSRHLDTGDAPASDSHAPASDSHAPAPDRGGPSASSGGPIGRAAPPTSRAATPTSHAATPTGRTTTPTSRAATPTSHAATPTGRTTTPTSRTTTPTSHALEEDTG